MNEQSRTVQNRTDFIQMDGWNLFIHLLALYFRPSLQHPSRRFFFRFAFVCNFVRSFLFSVVQLRKLSGCSAFFPLRQHFTQVQSCRSSSSHQIQFHFVIVFFFFLFKKNFPLLFLLKKRKPSVVVDSFTVFFAPFVLKFARLLLKLLVL